jgi:peptide/nickel transport system permease protein
LDANTCEGHLLGTDELGRDLLARLGYGGEISLGLSLIAVIFEVVLGVGFGVLACYGSVALNYGILRVAEALSCFPAWPFVIFMIYIATSPTRETLPLIALAAVTAVLLSPQIIRLIGSAGHQSDIVTSVSNQAARDFTRIIVLLATVDFFGFGVQPPTPTWGNMLAGTPENLQIAWWAAVFPAVCLFLAVLTVEIFRRRFLRSGASAPVGTNLA